MTEPAREPDTLPTDPAAVRDAAPAHSTPPSHRFRCPHCHNPIQLADGHSDEVLCPACGHSFRVGDARATISAAPMRPLGKFQLLERIGAGGFGAVWKAQDTTLDRTVALKIPHSGMLTTAADLERFQREARAAAQLRHPGIVPVHEVVMLEGLPTIVSDFVTGVPLKDLMETRRLGIRDTATLVAAAADAVHYAHSMGVVHRDLKPANIMVPYVVDPAAPTRQVPQLDRPLLMDFGLALRTDAEVTLTQDGHVLGTPAYMSPEQAAGRSHQTDARSDVWALGVVMYELLTGELPFRGSKVMMLMQVMNDEPKSPRWLDRAIPRDLETICLKCLQKEPSKRYATAADLAADLRRLLSGEPVLARRIGRTERLWRWCRRNPTVASLLATVALLLSAGTTVSTYFAIQADRRADEAEKSAERARQKEVEARDRAKEAEVAREEAQISLARSWLGPIGLRPNEPLIDAEISVLWQLAEVHDDGQRYRFVHEALRTPETTHQLRNQAAPALHATMGLDPERRAAVERLLLERMRDTALGDDHRAAVALAAVALKDLTPASSAAVASFLAQAMSKTTDINALTPLGRSLSALAARLEPKDAAATATILAQAMSKTTAADALNELATSLSAVAERLETREAARVSSEAVAILTQAISKTTDIIALRLLGWGLSALAARLEPKDAAVVLAQAMSKCADSTNLMGDLSPGLRLSLVAAGLEPKDAAATAAILAQAMSKTTDASILSSLAQGVAAVAARLEPKDSTRASAEAAAVLSQVMSKTTDASILSSLAQGVAAVAARLEPKDATRLSADAAAILAQAMSKTTDADSLSVLAQGLSAVAVRLAPQDAARVSAETAAVLAQAMSKTTDLNALSTLAQDLSAVAARLKPQAAADVAATLTWAIKGYRPDLTQGLTAVLNGCEPPDLSRRAVPLASAVGLLAGTGHPLGSLARLGPAVEPLPCRLTTQQLVDLLKMPTCIDAARRVILDYLGARYGQSFRDHWEFVEYAREHLPEVDLLTPPKRPRR